MPIRGEHFFIEANPRLQVEHTVTEEITGLNLVELQLRLAGGATLAELGLTRERIPKPRGMALQARINLESIAADGTVKPGGGTLTTFETPSGRGIRVDSSGYVGYRTSPAYDPLLAKLIVHTGSERLEDVLTKGYRALCEMHVAGAPTNIAFLQALLTDANVRAGAVDTDFVEANAAALAARAGEQRPHLYFEAARQQAPARAGAKIDAVDPLAVLAYGQAGQSADASQPPAETELPDGMLAVRAPLQGTIVSLAVEDGAAVRRGAQLAVMEAMKMEHVIAAEAPGIVRSLHVAPGDTIWEGQLLAVLEPAEGSGEAVDAAEDVDLDRIRPDLAEMLDRRALTRDEKRPEATARRRKTKQRTVRENVDDLVDPGTFVEYGPLTVAAQRRRRGLEDLLSRSPADGLVTGVGRINGTLFGDPASRAAILAYDYTVFAGTQGVHNHWKTDRMIDVAEKGRMPLVLFAEGGGGRPGDDDYGGFIGFNTFHHFGQLSGLVPMVGHRLRLLLRRQRVAARLLRRDHRHGQRQHRHGRPGHDRGRRARRVPPGGDRARLGAAPQRRHRHRRRRRGGGRGRGQALPRLFPGPGCGLDGAGPAAHARHRAGEPVAGLRHAQGHRDARRRRLHARAQA